jgi:hypothetical protein
LSDGQGTQKNQQGRGERNGAKTPSPRHTTRELICVDSTGPFATPSHKEGFKHLLIFKGVASKYIWDFYTTEVTATFSIECLKEVKSKIQNLGFTLRHSLRWRKLISHAHREYFIENSYNSPYTPEDNPHAERSFSTIKIRSLAQLLQSIPPQFWNFSTSYTVHITNRLPHQTSKGFISPYQFLHGEPPNLGHTRIWGLQVVVHTPKQKRANDWAPKGTKGIFMGIHREATAYQIYLPGEDKLICSSHVFFQEPPIPSTSPPLPAFLVQTLPKSAEDYQYLCGLLHIDDEDNMKYITTRVTTLKGYIVAYRAIYSRKAKALEINQSIHVKDIERLTYKFPQGIATILRSTSSPSTDFNTRKLKEKTKKECTITTASEQ